MLYYIIYCVTLEASVTCDRVYVRFVMIIVFLKASIVMKIWLTSTLECWTDRQTDRQTI